MWWHTIINIRFDFQIENVTLCRDTNFFDMHTTKKGKVKLHRFFEKVDLGAMHNGFYTDTRNATCTDCTLRNWWILKGFSELFRPVTFE